MDRLLNILKSSMASTHGPAQPSEAWALTKIWRFFSKYDIDGLINTTSVAGDVIAKAVSVFPNPTADAMTIIWPGNETTDYILSSLTGQLVQKGRLSTGRNELDMTTVATGMYMMTIGQQVIKIVKAE